MTESIKFIDDRHKEFYLMHGANKDSYFKSLMYLIGLTEDTRLHFTDIYSPGNGINRDSINQDWVTGETSRLLLLAFNLWNDYRHGRNNPLYDERDLKELSNDEFIEMIDDDSRNTVTSIFSGGLGYYYLQAINLRFSLDDGESSRLLTEKLIEQASQLQK